MIRQLFDQQKTIESILYVANKLQRKDFHKIFKVLYFADREHLSTYGRTITGDTYIAMGDGPVPSNIFDIFKSVRGDGFFANQADQFRKDIEVQEWCLIKPKRNADLYFLSNSDIQELDKSLDTYGRLTWTEIREKSHDYAWHKTVKGQAINVEDILTESGNDEQYIYCISNQMPNR